MFIAQRSFHYSEAPQERNRSWLPPAKVPLPGFAPNGARFLSVRP